MTIFTNGRRDFLTKWQASTLSQITNPKHINCSRIQFKSLPELFTNKTQQKQDDEDTRTSY
jgi:hypothetical protein